MSYDWSELDKNISTNNQPKYKTYAPNGEYTVTLADIEIVDRDTWKSPAIRFIWAEDDKYQYPKSINHWLSLPNPAWRAVHNRNILMALGIEKDKAQELVEAAEKDQDREKLKQGYKAMYKRVAERKSTTTIVVQDQWRNGQPVKSEKGTVYGESDFQLSTCRMMETHDETAPQIEDEEINLDDIPF